MKYIWVALLVCLTKSTYFEVNLDSIMTLGWDINQQSSSIQITIKVLTIQCKLTYGYCAVGLGSGMQGADIFEVIAYGSYLTLNDMYSYGHYSLISDSEIGGINSLTVISSSILTSSVEVTFSRQLDTGEATDLPIIPNAPTSIIWAYLSPLTGNLYHGNDRCNFYLDSANFVWSTSGNNYVQITSEGVDRSSHGIIMSVAWGALVTIGIFSMRYFKTFSGVLLIHLAGVVSAFLMTIINSSNQFQSDENPYNGFELKRLMHSRIGMTLSSLVVVQIFFGLVMIAMKDATKSTQMVILIRRFHKFLGYTMFITGLRNLYNGWELNGGDDKYIMIIIYTLVPLLFGSMELYQFFIRNKRTAPDEKLKVSTYKEVLEQVKNGVKLSFVEEYVVELGHFSLAHPGGRYFILETMGEDLSKYMMGCRSYSEKLNCFSHPDAAFAMVKQIAVGRLLPPVGYISSSEDFYGVFMEFKLANKKTLNDHTYVFYLESDLISVSDKCKEPGWLGKYFVIKKKICNEMVYRQYFCMLCEFEKWTGNELEDAAQETSRKEYLKFVIRVIKDGKMTSYLNSLQIGQILNVKGPLGPGLLLEKLEGTFLALASGTGLVPFLDLVEIAWKQFGSTSSSFKLIFYVFFETREDGFAISELEKMRDSCDWLDLRAVTDGDERKDAIANEIKEKLENGVSLAWISGDSGFNRDYCEMLLRFELRRDQIIVI